jgi:hypothetical protein
MGMDVYGRNPTSKEGEYFRNNVWWWRPLAEYCMEVAPEIAARCEGWHYNDGDGLNEALQREIDSGRCKRWAEIRKSTLEQLPNEPCRLCEATGTRKKPPELPLDFDGGQIVVLFADEIEIGAGSPATGIKCNGCNGEGYVRPFACSYGFSVENVQNFVSFLRASAGFVIW